MEQRKNQRFPLRLPVAIVNGESTKIVGETKDMSSSGVYFTVDGQLFVGQSIEYNITFPRTPKARAEVILRCVGKVIRHESEASAYGATLERHEFVREPFGKPAAAFRQAAGAIGGAPATPAQTPAVRR